MRGRARIGALAAQLTIALVLAACATTPAPKHARAPSPHAGLSLATLPGWAAEDHAAAFAAYRQLCGEVRRLGATRPCAEARAAGALDERAARAFLETHFRAELAPGEGLLTAYFAPVYDARHAPDEEFAAPVRPPPPDPAGAPERAEIDRQPTDDALAWMRPEDLFFLQIQGSGTLVFSDGERARATFAASNSRDFVPIGRPMLAQHMIAPGEAANLHAWLAAHRGHDADAAMELDPRYVFFRLAPDDATEPRGAAGVPLPPGRSIAVDPREYDYFELFWIDAGAPILPGAKPGYQRLVFALDTGGAIKGPVRADLYLGRGEAAGAEASRVRHTLRLYHIVPTGQ
jgi:peptidoglycan lytic transglycosylase A